MDAIREINALVNGAATIFPHEEAFVRLLAEVKVDAENTKTFIGVLLLCLPCLPCSESCLEAIDDALDRSLGGSSACGVKLLNLINASLVAVRQVTSEKGSVISVSSAGSLLRETTLSHRSHPSPSPQPPPLPPPPQNDSIITLSNAENVVRNSLRNIRRILRLGDNQPNPNKMLSHFTTADSISLLLRAPMVASVALHSVRLPLPKFLSPQTYYTTVLLSLYKAAPRMLPLAILAVLKNGGTRFAVDAVLKIQTDSDSDFDSEINAFSKTVVSALVTSNNRALLVDFTQSFMKTISSSKFKSKSTSTSTSTSKSTSKSSLDTQATQKLVKLFISPLLLKNGDTAKECLTRLLLQSSTTNKTLAKLTAYACKLSSNLKMALELICQSWSEHVFVLKADERVQLFVTEFVLECLRLMDSLESDDSVVSTLITGVSARLESPMAEIRKSGMKVGEAVAKLLGQELQFDELADQHIDVDVDADGDGDGDQPDPSPTISYSSESDSDDSAAPYDLSDEEDDLQLVRKPTYLKDCLQLLRAPESDKDALNKLETSLETIESIVRSEPPDLGELGVVLANEMIHLENKFNTPRFGEMREKTVVALCVTVGVGVFDYLSKVLFDNISAGSRFDILQILAKSVEEMRGNTENENVIGTKVKTVAGATTGKRSVVESGESENSGGNNINNKTVRWGKLNRKTNVDIYKVKNKFGPIATHVFYSLLGAFVTSQKDSNIWKQNDAEFLVARIINVLASYVENSKNFVDNSNLAKDLFNISFKFHGNYKKSDSGTALRGAILHAMCISFYHLANHEVYHLVNQYQLERWIDNVVKTDGNGRNRELAKILKSTCGVGKNSLLM